MNDSLYVPTPQRTLRADLRSVAVPQRVCFMDLVQLDKFLKQMNQICSCNTPGCSGSLVPASVRYSGLGGAVSVSYCCDGCASQWALFEALANCGRSGSSDISIAVQVAFIVAGCTHAVYCKALQLALGMHTVSKVVFMETIQKMHPVVEAMLNELCEEAKNEMKPWIKLSLALGAELSLLPMALGR